MDTNSPFRTTRLVADGFDHVACGGVGLADALRRDFDQPFFRFDFHLESYRVLPAQRSKSRAMPFALLGLALAPSKPQQTALKAYLIVSK
jgi:hypothetical protein